MFSKRFLKKYCAQLLNLRQFLLKYQKFRLKRDVNLYWPEEVAEEEDGACDEGEEGGGEGEHTSEDYSLVTHVPGVIHDVTSSLEMSASRGSIMIRHAQKAMGH